MPRVKQYFAGPDGWSEWATPTMKGYRMICCDCGLSHTMEFRTLGVVRRISAGRFVAKRGKGHRVEFRVRRNEISTAAVRRHMKKDKP